MIDPELQSILEQLPLEAQNRLPALITESHLAQVLHSFTHKSHFAFRINPLTMEKLAFTEADIHATLQQLNISFSPLTGFDHTYVSPIADKPKLALSPLFTNGLIYIQNPASMLAVDALDINTLIQGTVVQNTLIPDGVPQNDAPIEVLDLAAAPGGKTSLIAVQLNNKGRIAAVEPNRNRFFRLKASLEQQGVTNAQCYMHDGRGIGGKTPARFDRVLLDAPCSSDTIFNIHQPDSMNHWSMRKVKTTARLQQQLIQSGFDALKPNGIMVYSTCAFSIEENEAVVGQFLQNNPNAQLVPYFPSSNMASHTLAQNIFTNGFTPLKISQFKANHIHGLKKWDENCQDLTQTLRVLPNGLFNGFYLAKIVKTI